MAESAESALIKSLLAQVIGTNIPNFRIILSSPADGLTTAEWRRRAEPELHRHVDVVAARPVRRGIGRVSRVRGICRIGRGRRWRRRAMMAMRMARFQVFLQLRQILLRRGKIARLRIAHQALVIRIGARIAAERLSAGTGTRARGIAGDRLLQRRQRALRRRGIARIERIAQRVEILQQQAHRAGIRARRGGVKTGRR